ncbi:hypothetical protein Avbf_16992 [Armadillidium vulgare]|nr:hypothetical protein Avbf_16992 [Armadillidium vulgare]
MFHKYADCVWDSAKEAETFWKGIEMCEICEEQGGQLMSFEKFPTEEEFIDYVSKLRSISFYLKSFNDSKPLSWASYAMVLRVTSSGSLVQHSTEAASSGEMVNPMVMV